jgi:Flp pilus assembly pilin Flp
LAGRPGRDDFDRSPLIMVERRDMFWQPMRKFLLDETGPTATEYAVMLALILAVVIVAIGSVGGATGEKWNNNSSQIISAIDSSGS